MKLEYPQWLKKVIDERFPRANWLYDTSEGTDGSVGPFTFSYDRLYIKRKNSGAKSHMLSYNGVGPGISVGTPAGLTWAKKEFWSRGNIFLGPGAKTDPTLDDFAGVTFVYSTSVGFGDGVQGAVYFLGGRLALNRARKILRPQEIASEIIASTKAVAVVIGQVEGLIIGAGHAIQVGWTSVG